MNKHKISDYTLLTIVQFYFTLFIIVTVLESRPNPVHFFNVTEREYAAGLNDG